MLGMARDGIERTSQLIHENVKAECICTSYVQHDLLQKGGVAGTSPLGEIVLECCPPSVSEYCLSGDVVRGWGC